MQFPLLSEHLYLAKINFIFHVIGVIEIPLNTLCNFQWVFLIFRPLNICKCAYFMQILASKNALPFHVSQRLLVPFCSHTYMCIQMTLSNGIQLQKLQSTYIPVSQYRKQILHCNTLKQNHMKRCYVIYEIQSNTILLTNVQVLNQLLLLQFIHTCITDEAMQQK